MPDSLQTTVHVRKFGLADYLPIWHEMQRFTAERDEQTPDEIWILEHPPVFTLGLNGKPEHLLQTSEAIPVIPVDRGGQITYHGPGQLVIYFLLDLRRKHIGVRQFVEIMENSIIELLRDYQVNAEHRKDAPGVYVEGKKIAALGIRVKHGRCYHGLSFNLDMDLAPFSMINPCGYAGLEPAQLVDLVDSVDKKTIEDQLLEILLNHLGYNEKIMHD